MCVTSVFVCLYSPVSSVDCELSFVISVYVVYVMYFLYIYSFLKSMLVGNVIIAGILYVLCMEYSGSLANDTQSTELTV